MQNFVQEGETVGVPAPYALASGDGCLVGSLFGVSTGVYANGATAQIKIEGVCNLTKVSAQAWTVGQLIYWDNAAKNCTTTVSTNKLIGVALLVAANPSTVGQVLLNSAFVS